MKTHLRNLRDGRYLKSAETWTDNIRAACDFQSVSRALALVRDRRLPDMELVFAEGPPRIGAMPFEALTLKQLLAEETC